ncbi:gamma-glutamyl-gamma-aminobutyrate hydrolase family protein [Pedomonas mirosovicensis]|uniref:gamma-glutamyl-gamma-aminobutyrate hydrolase family protein n=1 Tax=Pedomonas mirosovicensis TaxID=2908641 RepID=UPI002168EB4D|nr:gamma-glutamyl-gamma-aminobutyrate hydrolase family protein [Pedomonas mirosovicensis]MCH8685164.1 gamma-glutamyl-gamma-aminobutyrate hydrolase family protein [Pedomonas mirosovicensis]
MSARPVIGIICCARDVDGVPAQTVLSRYITTTMRHADAAAVLVPGLPELMSAEEVAPLLDGLLLTGSTSNIDPKHYGDPIEEPPGPFDPGRDTMVLALIQAMLDRSKPIFGICRGFQELNVAFGGTLRRDMAEHPALLAHHAPPEMVFPAMYEHVHEVDLTPDGVLAGAMGKHRITVNSVHYQGIDRLGEGLKVEARASDGVVEAFSTVRNGAPVLAVQWHPEWRTAENPDSQAFFSLMGRLLRGEELAVP